MARKREKSSSDGAHGGKGSAAHKRPSLNILIKLVSVVSVVTAGLVVQYSLQGMELF